MEGRNSPDASAALIIQKRCAQVRGPLGRSPVGKLCRRAIGSWAGVLLWMLLKDGIGTYCCPWTDKCLWMSPFPWTSGCVAPAQVSLPHSRPLDNNHLRWGVDSGCFVQAFSFIFCFWFYLALVKLKKNDLLYSTLCVNMGRGEDVRRTVGSRGDQKEVHIPELELEAVVNCSKQFQGNRIL